MEECQRGHPRTEANTIRRKNGKRECRVCRNARRRKPYTPRWLPDQEGGKRKCNDCGRMATRTSRSLCPACYDRAQRNGTIHDHARLLYRKAALVETLRFIVSTEGGSLEQIAARVDRHPGHVERVMREAGIKWARR